MCTLNHKKNFDYNFNLKIFLSYFVENIFQRWFKPFVYDIFKAGVVSHSLKKHVITSVL